jgi:hypothetical protein
MRCSWLIAFPLCRADSAGRSLGSSQGSGFRSCMTNHLRERSSLRRSITTVVGRSRCTSRQIGPRQSIRNRAARRSHRGVWCLGGRGAGARDWASASGRLRCGLLRLAGRGLPSAWGDAESGSARVPRCGHAGAVLPRERDPVGGRAARCGCGRCDDGACRVARRCVLARRVPADGGVAFGP